MCQYCGVLAYTHPDRIVASLEFTGMHLVVPIYPRSEFSMAEQRRSPQLIVLYSIHAPPVCRYRGILADTYLGVTLGLLRNRSVWRIKGNQATFDNSQRNNLRSCLWVWWGSVVDDVRAGFSSVSERNLFLFMVEAIA